MRHSKKAPAKKRSKSTGSSKGRSTSGRRKVAHAVRAGSGNVYADLGFIDANERLAKSELAQRITQIIEEKGLTQLQAAQLLGVDQPKISRLTRGQLKDFSTERLLHFLNALGQDIEIVIKAKTSIDKPAVIRVYAA